MFVEISAPSGVEPSRLDDRGLDIPRWRKLIVQGFGKALQSFCWSDCRLRCVEIWRLTELSSTIIGKTGHCIVPAGGADVKDISALVGGTVLSEELDSLGQP